MTKLYRSARAGLLLYRMQIFWFLFFTINQLGASMLTALAGVNWDQADTQTRWMIVIGVIVTWTNAMMALFNKSMSRVERGEAPFIESQPASDEFSKTPTPVP